MNAGDLSIKSVLNHGSAVGSCSWGLKHCLSGGLHSVKLWDPETSQLISEFRGLFSMTTFSVWGSDIGSDDRVCVGSAGNLFALWDCRSKTVISRLDCHDMGPCRLSPDTKHVCL